MRRTIKISFITFVLFVLSGLISYVKAYEERNLLQNQVTLNELKHSLILNQKWVPYPDYADRKGWDNFFGVSKDKIIEKGESALSYKW